MPDVADLLRVDARMQIEGQTVMNVYYAAPLVFVSNADSLNDIASQLDTMHSVLNGRIVNNLGYVDITVTNMTTGVAIGTTPWPVLVNGNASLQTALPLGVAGLVTMNTLSANRRGRKFICGLHTGNIQDDGLFDVGTVNALITYGTFLVGNWAGPVSGALYRWVVPRTGTLLFASIESITVQNVPSYQRRRKPGVGI